MCVRAVAYPSAISPRLSCESLDDACHRLRDGICGRPIDEQSVDLMGHQARNSRDARRHNRQACAHRLEQHARNAFARQRRQDEQVVARVARQQSIERNCTRQGNSPVDATATRLLDDRGLLVFSRAADRWAHDVECDVDARIDQSANRVGKHAQAFSWIDSADGQRPHGRAGARVRAGRDVTLADRRGRRFESPDDPAAHVSPTAPGRSRT